MIFQLCVLCTSLQEVTGQLDSEQQQREGLKKNLEKAEKKNGTLQVELDEARSQFEHQQRLYKNSEAERNESSDRVLELSSKVTSLEAAKRKADQQIHSLQEEFDEAESENRENSEKLKNSLEQVARLQSELFSHQESVSSLEKQKVSTVFERLSAINEQFTPAMLEIMVSIQTLSDHSDILSDSIKFESNIWLSTT